MKFTQIISMGVAIVLCKSREIQAFQCYFSLSMDLA